MRQFQCVPTAYVTENKENYLEIYTCQVSCQLSLPLLLISIKMHVTILQIVYILVKSCNRPRVFLQIFGKAIRTISISFAFLNRPVYQSSITENS